MSEQIRVLAGDCTTTFDGARSRIRRGDVVVLVKPDRTVLVHDADGYQPISWLTRPDSVTVEEDGDGFSVVARAAEQTLRVHSHAFSGSCSFPAAEAGIPIGTCPDCDGPLVRTSGDVHCLSCGDRYGLPAGAAVLDSTCSACGLPRIRAERGGRFDLCLDYACESLADAVRERFDGEWACPDCGAPLRVRSPRGRLFFGCEGYPDCETAFSIPAGVVVDDCACGLPRFRTASGRRCLDGTCEHDRPAEC
ncbi:topoisomerase DNA-binding C4 zinc finger domain-containing protein [Haloferacaceae archaeon DSL9]